MLALVPTRQIQKAQPAVPPGAATRFLASAARRAMAAFDLRTEPFTPVDLQTIVTLAEHFERTA